MREIHPLLVRGRRLFVRCRVSGSSRPGAQGPQSTHARSVGQSEVSGFDAQFKQGLASGIQAAWDSIG